MIDDNALPQNQKWWSHIWRVGTYAME